MRRSKTSLPTLQRLRSIWAHILTPSSSLTCMVTAQGLVIAVLALSVAYGE